MYGITQLYGNNSVRRREETVGYDNRVRIRRGFEKNIFGNVFFHVSED